MNKKKVVIIGGGHGQSIILRGIKNIEHIDISTIVTVADDGGSTGRLRHYFNVPAMGDIRGVMLALSESESLLTELMNFRFESSYDGLVDQDVIGHNLGNLIMLALMQTNGSLTESIDKISQVIKVKGKIIPSTTEMITLYAEMEDGEIIEGETHIPKSGKRIKQVFYKRQVEAYEKACQAIMEADLIIYGIGSLYTSILPNVIIPKIKDALLASKALKVYFCNAMSQPGETTGYDLQDHVEALLMHGAVIDRVVMANDFIPNEILKSYEQQLSYPIVDCGCSLSVSKYSLLDFSKNLVRHDSLKVKQIIEQLIKEIS